eukprot:scaffold9235_cov112-Isochrysis_galbana.AAC.4
MCRAHCSRASAQNRGIAVVCWVLESCARGRVPASPSFKYPGVIDAQWPHRRQTVLSYSSSSTPHAKTPRAREAVAASPRQVAPSASLMMLARRRKGPKRALADWVYPSTYFTFWWPKASPSSAPLQWSAVTATGGNGSAGT